MRLYGEIIHSLKLDRTGAQTMLYLTCTMISSVDLAHYGLYLAEDLSIWGLWYNIGSHTFYFFHSPGKIAAFQNAIRNTQCLEISVGLLFKYLKYFF